MFKVIFAETRGELEKILNERYPDAHVISINSVVESNSDYTYEAWIKIQQKDLDTLFEDYYGFIKHYGAFDNRDKVRFIDFLILEN